MIAVTLILMFFLCRDDLPLQLRLPTALHEAETLQQLNEFTLLGQSKCLWLFPLLKFNFFADCTTMYLHINVS